MAKLSKQSSNKLGFNNPEMQRVLFLKQNQSIAKAHSQLAVRVAQLEEVVTVLRIENMAFREENVELQGKLTRSEEHIEMLTQKLEEMKGNKEEIGKEVEHEGEEGNRCQGLYLSLQQKVDEIGDILKSSGFSIPALEHTASPSYRHLRNTTNSLDIQAIPNPTLQGSPADPASVPSEDLPAIRSRKSSLSRRSSRRRSGFLVSQEFPKNHLQDDLTLFMNETQQANKTSHEYLSHSKSTRKEVNGQQFGNTEDSEITDYQIVDDNRHREDTHIEDTGNSSIQSYDSENEQFSVVYSDDDSKREEEEEENQNENDESYEEEMGTMNSTEEASRMSFECIPEENESFYKDEAFPKSRMEVLDAIISNRANPAVLEPLQPQDTRSANANQERHVNGNGNRIDIRVEHEKEKNQDLGVFDYNDTLNDTLNDAFEHEANDNPNTNSNIIPTDNHVSENLNSDILGSPVTHQKGLHLDALAANSNNVSTIEPAIDSVTKQTPPSFFERKSVRRSLRNPSISHDTEKQSDDKAHDEDHAQKDAKACGTSKSTERSTSRITTNKQKLASSVRQVPIENSLSQHSVAPTNDQSTHSTDPKESTPTSPLAQKSKSTSAKPAKSVKPKTPTTSKAKAAKTTNKRKKASDDIEAVEPIHTLDTVTVSTTLKRPKSKSKTQDSSTQDLSVRESNSQSSNSQEVNAQDSDSAASRPRRRCSKKVNYALPSLRTKLRKDVNSTFDAVTGQDLSGIFQVNNDFQVNGNSFQFKGGDNDNDNDESKNGAGFVARKKRKLSKDTESIVIISDSEMDTKSTKKKISPTNSANVATNSVTTDTPTSAASDKANQESTIVPKQEPQEEASVIISKVSNQEPRERDANTDAGGSITTKTITNSTTTIIDKDSAGDLKKTKRRKKSTKLYIPKGKENRKKIHTET